MTRKLTLGALTAIVIGVVTALTVSKGRRATPARPPSGPAARVASPVPEVVARAAAGRRVIFVGLDGADWSLLDQYIARGVMPALARLVKESASGTITTIHPPLSPLIWTTMMTGVSPLEHRILDFLHVDPTTGRREPITSDERRAPAIWNIATYGGKRVGAFGFWATYPAEAVNGLLVSDRLFTFLYSESAPPPGVVYPQALEAQARATLKRVEQEVGYAEVKDLLPPLGEPEYREAVAVTDPYAHPVSALRRILIETRVYDELARDWFAREKPDLTLVYVQGTDSVGHVFAPYAPPRQPSVSPAEYARYSDVPERYFERVDRMLDAYRKLAQTTDSALVLASDHGFKWTEGRPTELSSVAHATAARWHTDEGIYLIWGPGVVPSDGHRHRGSVRQICATLLALLGLPAGKGIAAPPLPGGPQPSGEALDYRAHYVPAAPVRAAPGTAPAAAVHEAEESLAKLRALGYIGAAEGSGRTIGTRTAGSFNNEGLLLKQQGKLSEAIEGFENALIIDPNLASALWNLSDLLFSKSESLDKADTLLVRAFANGLPEGTKFLIGRAIGYQRNGQLDRSLKLLNMAAAAKPDEPEVWLFRGRYRVESGDCTGALADFEQATRRDPANAAAYASRGLAHLCAGDPAGARRSFQRSLALDPKQPKVREYLRRGKP